MRAFIYAICASFGAAGRAQGSNEGAAARRAQGSNEGAATGRAQGSNEGAAAGRAQVRKNAVFSGFIFPSVNVNKLLKQLK